MEMCVDYFIRTKDVSLIPEDKRAELFNFIFQMTHNLEIIPLEYRTKEMCKIALQIDLRNFKFIPAELLSKKDYLIYFTKTHDINPIPKEYRLEICKAYFQEQINNKQR